MAVCDAYYKFIYVDVGNEGSNHDGNIFRKSIFGKALLEGTLKIPGPKKLDGTDIMLPHFFVADQAFPLHKSIMRPYPGTYLDETKNIFDMRFSRARRTIENTFGILVQRWRRLRNPIIAAVNLCFKIVLACVVLHNYIQKGEEDIPLSERQYCPTGYTDHLGENGELRLGACSVADNLESVGRIGTNNASRIVQLGRDSLAQYFISPSGAVPYQWNKVHAGGFPNNF